jgi:dihydroorotate dehydrogenase (fumarate)
MTDLHTEYLGLRLRSPLVASAGPYTGELDRMSELQDAGVGAIVLPSLFEEQIERDTSEIDRLFSLHRDSFGEASSFFPELDDYNTGADAYLALVEAAKNRVDVPVIASLNGVNIGGWMRYARLLEDAGADAIELNLYTVAADPSVNSASIEAEQLELVALLTDDVKLPVSVKISPFYSSLASFLLGLQNAGAAGVVMFNRFYAPDLDMETLDMAPKISLSSQAELRLPLRWIGIAREFLTISIAGSTGVHSGRDAAKLILAGADVAMSTSALLFHGTGYISIMEGELCEWMSDHGYQNVGEMRGAVSRDAVADPAAYERANYIGNITSYSSRFLGAQPIGLRHKP